MTSNGALLFAFDTVTDQGVPLYYTKLANITCKLIKKHLDIPCAVVTDGDVPAADEIIYLEPKTTHSSRTIKVGDIHQTYEWKNDYRLLSYDLSPWKQTLVIDVDYILQSKRLKTLLDSKIDFTIAQNVTGLVGQEFDRYHMMPNRTIPQCWATVMCFNQNAKTVFEYAKMISDNYEFYASIFGFDLKQYRNDMVFSIAAHMLQTPTIPWNIVTASSKYYINKINKQGHLIFEKDPNDGMQILSYGDVHILNKNITSDLELINQLESWADDN